MDCYDCVCVICDFNINQPVTVCHHIGINNVVNLLTDNCREEFYEYAVGKMGIKKADKLISLLVRLL